MQLRAFFGALCRQDTLISINAELLAILSVLILDEGLELFSGLDLGLNLELLNVLLEVLLATCPLESHSVLSHAQLLQMLLDIVDCLLIVR